MILINNKKTDDAVSAWENQKDMSERKTTIIMINMDDHSDAKVYGSLRKACDAEGWVYNTLVQKPMPFQQGRYIVNRVVFN